MSKKIRTTYSQNDKKPIRVLFIAAELYPLVKVGGLADVAYALPRALSKLGVAINPCSIYYTSIHWPSRKIMQLRVPFNRQQYSVYVYTAKIKGIKNSVYLFKNKEFLSPGKVYVGPVLDPFTKKMCQKDIKSKLIRFLFFHEAIKAFLLKNPYQFSLVHGNDWHGSIIINHLKKMPALRYMKSLLTFHNLSPKKFYCPCRYAGLSSIPTQHLMTDMLKNADIISVVSPQYAKDVQTKKTNPFFYHILQKRKKDVYGILNGLDYQIFNPQTDKHIYNNYKYHDWRQRKKENKIKLQKKLGLPTMPNILLIGMIGRLIKQKGYDILIPAIAELTKMNVQLVCMGIGEKHYASALQKLARQYPEYIKFININDPSFAQQIYASSDIIIIPSLFEPCSLTAMIAMTYGAIPLVRSINGLENVITNNRGGGYGFTFQAYSAAALIETVAKAKNLFEKNTKQWQNLINLNMHIRFSWEKAAKQYLKLYKLCLKK